MATEVRDELTWQVPSELVDALLEETQTRERRLRDLPARAGVFFVLASLAAPGSPPGRLTPSHQHRSAARTAAAIPVAQR
jgi:hypothetical protein